MPIYEYRCTGCQHTFDLHQTVGEAAPVCPRCGAVTRKVYASVGLIFKGSGFHTTDYRKTGAGNGDKSEHAAASPGSKDSASPGSKDGASTPSASSSASSSPSGSSADSRTGSGTS